MRELRSAKQERVTMGDLENETALKTKEFESQIDLLAYKKPIDKTL